MVELDDYNKDILRDSLEAYRDAKKAGQTPVKDITTFVEELIGNNSNDHILRPYSPPTSNLIDLVDPNKSVITKKLDQTVVIDYSLKTKAALQGDPKELETGVDGDSETTGDGGPVRLEYDALLDCYYDPVTGKYHAMK